MTDLPNATERVYFDPPDENTDYSWWDGYISRVRGMSPTSLAALYADTTYILDRGVFGDGEPGTEAWPTSRVRTGLVMGSVQSGKTASMLGVSALALDRQVDIVVILAGTRLPLWRQTYERLLEQLDSGGTDSERASRRILSPRPGVILSDANVPLNDLYRLTSAQVRRKLKDRDPIVIVALKQAHHLHALGSSLRTSVFPAVETLNRNAHMLVLDDESDDGSVLDAAVEAGEDPISGNLKQIPRAIADLWDPRTGGGPTNLYATYVGYTATPQANLLQEDHNPLAPRDFVVSLRTPLDRGHPIEPNNPEAPRSSTYPEPAGLDYFYTGGETFYRRGAAAGLCVALSGRRDEDLGEALRAFLVAGAIRFHREQAEAVGPANLSNFLFSSAAEATAISPSPHSMLYHPSSEIGQHFEGAEDVLIWSGIGTRDAARALIEAGDARLPSSLAEIMLTEEPLWEKWHDEYLASHEVLTSEFDVIGKKPTPEWHEIRELLRDEIIPGTRVSVVNSDPLADDRPQYKPSIISDGSWRAPRDVSTIFVSGNVMARGLTLEGLTTVLFQRQSANPLADTQMQMQRWFGYRGSYLELCRVFADSSQIELFATYHDIDESLRESISEAMVGEAPRPIVLQGLNFLATGKIANLDRRPLCQSARPFITLINSGDEPDPNSEVVENLFSNADSEDVVVGGITRGRTLTEPLSLNETADLLSSLRFANYVPSSDSSVAELWSQLQSRVSATLPLDSDTIFYQTPDSLADRGHPPRADCPYSISAYLRLWDASLSRPVRGLFVNGAPGQLWSLADLRLKSSQQPRFSVGIRYGGGDPVTKGPLADMSFEIPATRKRVGVGGNLETRWGANNPSAGPNEYRGDEYFDYYSRREALPQLVQGGPWRPAGSDGQILIYVNQLDGQPYPSIALGVCIPAGGPEQFAATRASSIDFHHD